MNYRIQKSYLFGIVFLIIFSKPTFVDVFAELSFLNNTFDVCRVAFMIGTPVIYILKKNHSYNIILIILIYSSLFLSTQLNHGELRSVILSMGNILACSMIVELLMKNTPLGFLKAMKSVFFVYILLNLITLLIFPNHWFLSGEVNADNWFLGNKNLFVMFHLPYLFSVYELAGYEHRKLKLGDIIGVICTVVCTLISRSATGIMGVGVFFAIYYMKAILKKAITAKMGFIVCYALFVLIVVLDLARLFSFLIVSILHKDLTLTVRTYVWEGAINWFKTSPLYGVGIQASEIAKSYMFDYYHPHCTYLYYLVFAGIIGFILFSVYLHYTAKRIDEQEELISAPGIAVFWSILIIYITEVYSRPELFFITFTIANCLSNNSKKRIHNSRRQRGLQILF